MLTPKQYETWPDSLVKISQDLEDYLITAICKSLAKENFDRFSSSSYQKVSRLVEWGGLSLQDVYSKISAVSGKMETEIQKLLEKAYTESVESVGYVYEAIGLQNQDKEFLKQALKAQDETTSGDFRNLTNSLGFSVKENGKTVFKPISSLYQAVLDFTQIKIMSGAVSPSEAIKDAAKQLADSGLKTVDYSSGRKYQLDVAVRTATVTGLSQLTGKIAEQQAKELDTDLVEVSAHSGARDTGSGFENHKSWQGKVYSLSGNHPKYPSLREKTGYGNVAGLKGANCRHDFSPYVEGVTIRQWTDDDLRNLDKPTITYDGVEYTAYEATQRQRSMESSMRLTKRRFLAFDAAGDKEEAQKFATLLSRQREEYAKFSKAAGLTEQLERAQVLGFGVLQSNKARKYASR